LVRESIEGPLLVKESIEGHSLVRESIEGPSLVRESFLEVKRRWTRQRIRKHIPGVLSVFSWLSLLHAVNGPDAPLGGWGGGH